MPHQRNKSRTKLLLGPILLRPILTLQVSNVKMAVQWILRQVEVPGNENAGWLVKEGEKKGWTETNRQVSITYLK